MPDPIILKLPKAGPEAMLKPRKHRRQSPGQMAAMHARNRRITKAKEQVWTRKVRAEKRSSS